MFIDVIGRIGLNKLIISSAKAALLLSRIDFEAIYLVIGYFH
jgi:hypothetical protein